MQNRFIKEEYKERTLNKRQKQKNDQYQPFLEKTQQETSNYLVGTSKKELFPSLNCS